MQISCHIPQALSSHRHSCNLLCPWGPPSLPSRPRGRVVRCQPPSRAGQVHSTPKPQTGPDNTQRAASVRFFGRRELVLNSCAALLLIGTDDPTTILNAVLSGYGLPTLKGTEALREYDEFENEWFFSYPRSWVARPNTQRSGFYVSNFQTADKATVESFPAPEGSGPDADRELVRRAVAAAVVPGSDQADDKLTLPADRLIKTEEKEIEGKRYIYMAFPSETLTRSGYAIKRKHFAVVAVKRGVAYTLSASARSDQYNKDKAALLQEIVTSFRVR